MYAPYTRNLIYSTRLWIGSSWMWVNSVCVPYQWAMLKNEKKKPTTTTAFIFGHGRRRRKKKHSQASHAENKLFIGKGVSFSVDVARVWLEVKALFTKEWKTKREWEGGKSMALHCWRTVKINGHSKKKPLKKKTTLIVWMKKKENHKTHLCRWKIYSTLQVLCFSSIAITALLFSSSQTPFRTFTELIYELERNCFAKKLTLKCSQSAKTESVWFALVLWD